MVIIDLSVLKDIYHV